MQERTVQNLLTTLCLFATGLCMGSICSVNSSRQKPRYGGSDAPEVRVPVSFSMEPNGEPLHQLENTHCEVSDKVVAGAAERIPLLPLQSRYLVSTLEARVSALERILARTHHETRREQVERRLLAMDDGPHLRSPSYLDLVVRSGVDVESLNDDQLRDVFDALERLDTAKTAELMPFSDGDPFIFETMDDSEGREQAIAEVEKRYRSLEEVLLGRVPSSQ